MWFLNRPVFASGATADGIKQKLECWLYMKLEGLEAGALKEELLSCRTLFFEVSLKFTKHLYSSHSSGCEGWLSR